MDVATLTPLERDIVGEAWVDLEPLVIKTARRFAASYVADADECLSLAHELFCGAVAQWCRGEANMPDLEGCVFHWVYYGLFDHFRREKGWRRAPRFRQEIRRASTAHEPMCGAQIEYNTDALADVDMPEDECDGVRMYASLSGFAQHLIGLVLTPPAELAGAIGKNTTRPVSWRSAIRRYLASRGWSPMMIDAAFTEIRNAS